jgi:ectoine hydroxylase
MPMAVTRLQQNPLSTNTMPSKHSYHSRLIAGSNIIPRQEPVIYSRSWENTPVDKSILESYQENGFVLLEEFFTLQEIAIFKAEADTLKDLANQREDIHSFRESSSNEIRSIFQVHLLSTVFKKLLHDERLVSMAKFILDDDVYIHQSRINYKPGFIGKEFYWHSDFETWHMEDGMPNMRALSVSITLTENFDVNGPLLLIPKSHYHFVQCQGKTPENHYQKSLVKQQYGVPDNSLLAKLVETNGIVSTATTQGSAIVFDCNTMHGSNGNITPYPRTNLFFVYNAISNQLQKPFCDLAPRPDFLATRENIKPI